MEAFAIQPILYPRLSLGDGRSRYSYQKEMLYADTELSLFKSFTFEMFCTKSDVNVCKKIELQRFASLLFRTNTVFFPLLADF